MRCMSALICTVCLAMSACSGSDPQAEPDDSTVTSEVVDTSVENTSADADDHDDTSVESTSADTDDDDDAAVADTDQLDCLPLAADGWSTSDQLADDGSDVVSMAANEQAVVVLKSDIAVTPYHSPDGLRWEVGDGFPRMVVGGPGVSVAGGPSGFVAVGTSDGTPPYAPIVAYSPDGATWEHLDPEDLPEAQVSWLTDVVGGPQGFIIVGSRNPPVEVHDPGHLLVWVSSDGRTWTGTDIPDLVTGTADRATVAATESGWAALTIDWLTDVNPTVGVWTSPDGFSWTEIEARGAPPTTAADAYTGSAPLVATGDRWVLMPAEGMGTPAVWVSADAGATWNEHTVGGAAESTGSFVSNGAATGVGLILTGSHFAGSTQSFLAHSIDGTSWQQCPTISEFSAVVPFGDGLVLVDAAGSTMVWDAP